MELRGGEEERRRGVKEGRLGGREDESKRGGEEGRKRKEGEEGRWRGGVFEEWRSI